MKQNRLLLSLACALAGISIPTYGQTTIQLDSVIGVSGTNAASVASNTGAVNFTGVASDAVGAPTTLTAPGSAGIASTFNFNTGFADSLDRATGFSTGSGNVFADMRYDSASTNIIALDTNFNGSFDGTEYSTALPGFGMHGDTFITFDLDVIRTNAGLGAGTTLYLTGIAGLPVPGSVQSTSAAIITDSTQRAVFDWNSSGAPGSLSSSFNLTLSGSTRYLTFIGLSGVDSDYQWAHIAFANVQLSTVPEPTTVMLLSAGLAGLGWLRLRRRMPG